MEPSELIGKAAPTFTLKDAYEEDVSLGDYLGKWLVLYFYPKDDTPGCTLEAMDFSALKAEFEAVGTTIAGISMDSCKSHQEFIDARKLTIRLLSDPDAAVQKAYGVWRPIKILGKEILGTSRTTFLIDPGGTVVKVWPKVNPMGHAKEVLEELKAIKGRK